MIYILYSRTGSGTLDTEKRTATVKGKDHHLDPGLEVLPGDSISVGGERFVVKYPGPYDFSSATKRIAQIIQPWDAGVILSYSSIGPGSNVLESGIGSGSLSYQVLRAIGETGSLTSVEINPSYIKLARENVSRLLQDTIMKRWTTVEGDISEYRADGKFGSCILDVPEPWAALKNVSALLKTGAILCFYCPTFNQTEKTVNALDSSGFHFLDSFEILSRNILVRNNATRPDNDVIGHTAFLSFALKLTGISVKA